MVIVLSKVRTIITWLFPSLICVLYCMKIIRAHTKRYMNTANHLWTDIAYAHLYTLYIGFIIGLTVVHLISDRLSNWIIMSLCNWYQCTSVAWYPHKSYQVVHPSLQAYRIVCWVPTVLSVNWSMAVGHLIAAIWTWRTGGSESKGNAWSQQMSCSKCSMSLQGQGFSTDANHWCLPCDAPKVVYPSPSYRG